MCTTLCCFMILPQPTSTLFPYTTLFRSLQILVGNGEHPRVTGDLYPARIPDPLQPCERARALRGLRKLDQQRDRKSTRLNSSHSQSSYAVFCLKKKISRARNVGAEHELN